jgi:hypothetical protein
MAYSEEEKIKIFDDICEKIIQGKSLRTALKELNTIPTKTFFVWLREDEDKSKQYARATIERADLMFEDMLDIADEQPERMETKNGTCIDTGHIQDKRVRIGTRQWALSKMMPKKYGNTPDETNSEDNELIIKIVE